MKYYYLTHQLLASVTVADIREIQLNRQEWDLETTMDNTNNLISV